MPLKKRLGQHLLTDTRALRRIADAAGAAPDTLILEIGPGTGLLTARLLDSGARVTAVELDDAMADRLESRFAVEKRLSIIRGDILKVPLPDLVPPHDRPALACGNLPYYISSPIIFRLLEFRNLFSRITVLVQKEVGERMCAPPGSRNYGMLSVFCSVAADCKLLFTVKRDSFKPQPKVDSALVSLVPASREKNGVENEEIFSAVVHGAFEHRRKTCYNSLRISAEKGGLKNFFYDTPDPGGILKDALTAAGADPAARPETIDPGTFINLAGILARHTGKQGRGTQKT